MTSIPSWEINVFIHRHICTHIHSIQFKPLSAVMGENEEKWSKRYFIIIFFLIILWSNVIVHITSTKRKKKKCLNLLLFNTISLLIMHLSQSNSSFLMPFMKNLFGCSCSQAYTTYSTLSLHENLQLCKASFSDLKRWWMGDARFRLYGGWLSTLYFNWVFQSPHWTYLDKYCHEAWEHLQRVYICVYF